ILEQPADASVLGIIEYKAARKIAPHSRANSRSVDRISNRRQKPQIRRDLLRIGTPRLLKFGKCTAWKASRRVPAHMSMSKGGY
ncbi:MAG: hypothetical protein ACREDA_07350, partial [Methylocella sp.]